ncbi:hypothetical protein PR048_027213 [Dryococelus australis]|uniref:Uncharacterized protein n=1 Tax=Dryococelus australis TaxID=614101 RepID=A0ABQ9GG86_9NEOP|nr:hypothetical protein PR048_027213 [Dryococelus australis]
MAAVCPRVRVYRAGSEDGDYKVLTNDIVGNGGVGCDNLMPGDVVVQWSDNFPHPPPPQPGELGFILAAGQPSAVACVGNVAEAAADLCSPDIPPTSPPTTGPFTPHFHTWSAYKDPDQPSLRHSTCTYINVVDMKQVKTQQYGGITRVCESWEEHPVTRISILLAAMYEGYGLRVSIGLLQAGRDVSFKGTPMATLSSYANKYEKKVKLKQILQPLRRSKTQIGECCCGGVVVDYSPPTKANRGSIPCGIAPGFSHLITTPGEAAGPRFFFRSGISRFLRPGIPELLHSHLASPSSALKASMLRAALLSPFHTVRANDKEFGRGEGWVVYTRARLSTRRTGPAGAGLYCLFCLIGTPDNGERIHKRKVNIGATLAELSQSCRVMPESHSPDKHGTTAPTRHLKLTSQLNTR